MKNIIKIISITSFVFLFSLNTIAQIAINSDGSSPDASAMLEITSSDKGILIPRMTTAERTVIVSPATGLLVYDTDENSFWYYANSTWAKVGNGSFTSDNGITHSNNNDDDFVVGADSLNYVSGSEYKMFFDKSKGTFRAGFINNTNWDESNIGDFSFATGTNTIASGNGAVAMGQATQATEYAATAFGNFTIASGTNAMAFGNATKATGHTATAFGAFTEAIGIYSTAFGGYTEAIGSNSTAFGESTIAYSLGEVALGLYNTVYTPNSTSSFDSTDRLLVVGNGTTDNSRSDAFVIHKNGNVSLNGALTIDSTYTFPITDGVNGQVLGTDGNGTINWTTLNELTDADSDTKIQVEESSDEDIIRFDLGGTEFLRLDSGRIEILNTGESVFLGEGAGANDNLTSNQNTFVGYEAGKSNINGDANVFEGYQSGYSNISGGYNVFHGYKSGYSNTTGSGNLFQGNEAGRDNTTGISNVFLGRNSGRENTTGGYNTFVGYGTGSDNLTGEDNLFLGYVAGSRNTTGTSNTFLGHNTGNNNTTGNNNVYIGNEAGLSNITGSNNILIGNEAGYNETASNQLYIENSNSSSPLIYGDFDADSLQINGKLNINGAFNFPTTDGTASQTLITDGNGTVSWSDLNTTLVTDADNDTKIQVEESSDEDIIRFDLGGTQFLRLDSGRIEILNTGESVFLGEDAGANDDLTYNQNVFVGYQAGKTNTTGLRNVFTGYQAGKANTTGLRNVFIGYKAGSENTSGDRNLFLGHRTGALSTASYRNVALGYEAGYSNDIGSGNVFLGYQSGYSETGNDKLYIENSNSSSPLIFGDFDADSLQINGVLNINGVFAFPTIDGSASQVLATDGSGNLSWTDNTDDQMIDVFSLSGNSLQLSLEDDGESTQTVNLSSFLDNTDNQTIDVFSLSGNNLQLSLEDDGASTQTVNLSSFLDNTDNQTIDVLGFSNNGLSISLENDGVSTKTIDLTPKYIADDGGNTKVDLSSSGEISFQMAGTEYYRMTNHQLETYNTGGSVFIGEGTGDNDDLSANLNIGIGNRALQTNTTGVGNLAIGVDALLVSTSSFNVSLGSFSGEQTTGGENVFIGYSAGINITTGSSNVMIGTDAGGSSNVSNTLFIDNSSTDSPLIWGDFSNNRVVINGNDGDNANNRTLFVNGAAGGTTSWQNDSDRRLKTNIQTIPNALNKVLEMRGVTYQWKDGRETGDRMGFIAQEVEPILPEVVDNKNDHYAMQYAPITAVLIEAVKEQQTLIQDLQAKNQKLTTEVVKINQQQSEIDELKAMLQQLQAQLNNQSTQNTSTEK